MSYQLIIIRHGQSLWNLENLFTGWTDVDLTEQGEAEAVQAGRGFRYDATGGSTSATTGRSKG